MSGSIVLPVVTKYSDKGLKQARHGLGSFKKSIGGLKGALGGLGLALGAGQLVSFGREAAKAASADAKSQALLAATQKKSANATPKQIKQSEAFIQTLSNQVGVIDDDLRPSLANLTRSTGSVSKGQKLLKIALNASAATGKPLATTTAAVSKAFHGQMLGLTRLFPELKNSKDALKALDNQTTGMAVLKADPFQKFNVGADNLKEKLGALILPKLTDFMAGLMKPGGAMDKLSAFIDQAGDPKTDAGKAFKDMGTGITEMASALGKFFGSKSYDQWKVFIKDAVNLGGAAVIISRVGLAFGTLAAGITATVLAILSLGGDASKAVNKNPYSKQMPKGSTGVELPKMGPAVPQRKNAGLGGLAIGSGTSTSGVTINIYGKASAADNAEVIRMIKNHERNNGTAWRK